MYDAHVSGTLGPTSIHSQLRHFLSFDRTSRSTTSRFRPSARTSLKDKCNRIDDGGTGQGHWDNSVSNTSYTCNTRNNYTGFHTTQTHWQEARNWHTNLIWCWLRRIWRFQSCDGFIYFLQHGDNFIVFGVHVFLLQSDLLQQSVSLHHNLSQRQRLCM